MPEFHWFDWERDAATTFTETRVPQVPTCRPPYEWTDTDGVKRYPLMLAKHTCSGCGAVWQYRDDFVWHLHALPTPANPQLDTARETDQPEETA